MTTSTDPLRRRVRRGREPSSRNLLAAAALVVLLGLAAGVHVAKHGGSEAPDPLGAVWDRVESSPARPSGRGSGGGAGADGDLGGDRVPVDADVAALTRLDPELLAAVRAAAAGAAEDGVEILVTSGWRSAAYQQRLLDQAIAKYGNREEAARWVADPAQSRHVTGDAVDVGPTDAAYWMMQHGATYRLCQTYANEVWHYELSTLAGGACPVPRADGSS